MNLSHGHTLLKGGKEGQVTTLLHTTRKTPPGGRFRLDMPVVARAANLAEVSLKVLLLNPELDFVALQVLVLVHGATAAAVVTS